MLDLQIIQRAVIVKAAKVHDANLENFGARAREAHANTDHAKLFDLANTAFGKEQFVGSRKTITAQTRQMQSAETDLV